MKERWKINHSLSLSLSSARFHSNAVSHTITFHSHLHVGSDRRTVCLDCGAVSNLVWEPTFLFSNSRSTDVGPVSYKLRRVHVWRVETELEDTLMMKTWRGWNHVVKISKVLFIIRLFLRSKYLEVFLWGTTFKWPLSLLQPDDTILASKYSNTDISADICTQYETEAGCFTVKL